MEKFDFTSHAQICSLLNNPFFTCFETHFLIVQLFKLSPYEKFN